MNRYKFLYNELKNTIYDKYIVISAIVACIVTIKDNQVGVIYISPFLTDEQKLVSLAHEIGHQYTVVKEKVGFQFKFSEETFSEVKANKTGCKILSIIMKMSDKKYYSIYNYLSKKDWIIK